MFGQRLQGQADRGPLLVEHGPGSRHDSVHRNAGDAMRRRDRAAFMAFVQSGCEVAGRLQLSALRSEAYRAVAVIGIAIKRVARDHDYLAVHGRSQMRRPAVVSDEQLAPFQHGTDLTKRRAAENNRLPRQLMQPASARRPAQRPEQTITGSTCVLSTQLSYQTRHIATAASGGRDCWRRFRGRPALSRRNFWREASRPCGGPVRSGEFRAGRRHALDPRASATARLRKTSCRTGPGGRQMSYARVKSAVRSAVSPAMPFRCSPRGGSVRQDAEECCQVLVHIPTRGDREVKMPSAQPRPVQHHRTCQIA